MTIRSPSVIVVGAGPAGATLAYLLGSRRISLTAFSADAPLAIRSLPSGTGSVSYL